MKKNFLVIHKNEVSCITIDIFVSSFFYYNLIFFFHSFNCDNNDVSPNWLVVNREFTKLVAKWEFFCYKDDKTSLFHKIWKFFIQSNKRKKLKKKLIFLMFIVFFLTLKWTCIEPFFYEKFATSFISSFLLLYLKIYVLNFIEVIICL